MSAVFSSDGKTLLTGYNPEGGFLSHRGYLWDVATGRHQKELVQSFTWAEDLIIKGVEKQVQLCQRLGAPVTNLFSITLSSDDTSILLKQGMEMPGNQRFAWTSLWTNGYSKDLMNWIAVEIKPLQAWLILKMLKADRDHKLCNIIEESFEHTLLESIPKEFKDYLVQRYSVKICPKEDSSRCSIQ
ncbi:hypothetical protein H0X06_06010 [Candidatus Dependentiae bacterium]|nr:hypothetical protein [Candidatus Dependentiae bacterium]